MRKMISSTSITSTSGVVLMAAMACSSSPPAAGMFIAMARFAQADALPARITECSSPLNSRTSSITAMLRRRSQL